MVKKWEDLKWEIFEYVSNRTKVIGRRDSIVSEILNKYKPEVIFNDVDAGMLQEFVGSVVDFSYFIDKKNK